MTLPPPIAHLSLGINVISRFILSVNFEYLNCLSKN